MKKIKHIIRDELPIVTYLHSKYMKKKNGIYDKIKSNSIFKNIHKGERCFILGTGPSIKDVEIKKLSNEYVICLNLFFKHHDFSKLNKKYICASPNHSPYLYQPWDYIFSQKYLNDVQIFIGDADYEFSISNYFRKNNLINRDNIHLLNYYSAPIANKKNINFKSFHDLSRGPLISPVTTLILALQIANYMGFEEINLLGIDHDQINQKKNTQVNGHFYENNEEYENLNNNQLDYKRIFSWYYNAWGQYQLFKNFYDNEKVNIFNLNKNSYLDVFPKKDIKI